MNDDLFDELTSSRQKLRVVSSAERTIERAQREIAAREADIARAERRLARLEAFPQVDKFPDETVILFYKKFSPGGIKYTYTALKVNGSWFTSGPTQAGVERTWVEIVDFITTGPLEPEVWIVSEWKRLV